MKKLVLCLFVIGCSGQKQVFNAPVANRPSAGFMLTLSLEPTEAAMSETVKTFDVRYTNTSSKYEPENMCGVFGQVYHLAVVYNGVPVDESEETKKGRVVAQSGMCKETGGATRNLQPGQSRDNILYYDSQKPGTYQFTVDEDTDPLHSEKDFRVTSNTVTVVVP